MYVSMNLLESAVDDGNESEDESEDGEGNDDDDDDDDDDEHAKKNCSDFKISKKFFFTLTPRICLVFDRRAHCEANLAEICTFLTKVLAGQSGRPTNLSFCR